ncbi:acetylornithine deacetylase [Pantoea sp. Aalb]|uniref:acetylornithine deacetylase n=1 Tax=Pantoea sp. Aalb TaxID=2576762 RepID=UPI001321EB42|nr:acetylornithine deacetylase [Pantoea sp. Aalb]MXP67919.1 acetylornithine deacetylase [Pantoea sp. Aalb]
MKIKLPSFIEIYRQLIAVPSISSTNKNFDQSNKDLIDLLANWFEELGYNIEVKLLPNNLYNNKFNMLARNKIETNDGGLLLTGHTDTVAYDDNQWIFNPFKLTQKDDKFYGLGSVDMKVFFAFILDVLRNVDMKKLNKPLYILATADEETTMQGARYFVESTLINPHYAIVGEPTSLKPVRGHKGYFAKIIHIQGKSGHSSNPSLGINAIEVMHQSITQLIKLQKILKKKYNHNGFSITYPTINFGQIKGGNAVNRICDYCELHIDIRPTPGLTIKQFNFLLNKLLIPVKTCWPGCLTVTDLHMPIPSYECSRELEFVKIIEKLSGTSTKLVNYCTEASFIQNLCPVLLLGPGSINQAHQPNEFLDFKFIKPTHTLIKKIIQYFCY